MENESSTSVATRGDVVEYMFAVHTNAGYLTAGTTSRVYVKIIGEAETNPATEWIRLNHFCKADFARGNRAVFFVRTKDVGKPLILEFCIKKWFFKNDWACSHTTVEYKGEEFLFPLEDWIYNKMSVARGKAFAYGKVDHLAVQDMRWKELDESRIRFPWIDRPQVGEIGWGLPRYVNEKSLLELPGLFQWSAGRLTNLAENGFAALINAGLDKLPGFGIRLTNLESYTEVYKHLHGGENPVFYDVWRTDEEFGRQQMNEISPLSFARCDKIPDNCQIAESHVGSFLSQGLEKEMQAGRVYLADYSKVFQGVPRTKNGDGRELYCPDAFCLYHVNRENNLVPIAIQLVPGDEETVFTPNDDEHEWLLAKMYFKVAFSNLHEWYYHFLLTHDVMETFGVAVFRCFPRSHPLYKLLRPHLQTIAFINSLARKTLINRTSAAYKALAINGGDMAVHMYKDFSFDDLVIPEVLKKKGLDDPELLPKFYYRDDALALWNIMEKYVSDVIGHYYQSDKDVHDDHDIQNFVVEMAYEGYGWQDGKRRGIPLPMRTKPQLIRLCTTIAFTTSAQHAAVNFGQSEMYKYIPNSPTAMRLPPPRRGQAHHSRIMLSLPDLNMSIITLIIASTLSSYSPNEVYIGNYPLQLFTEQKILDFQANYQDELKVYSERIKQRNNGMNHEAQKYIRLLPENVPNSIAI